MIYSQISLNKATLVERRHPKEVQPPGMLVLDGLISSRSDTTVTLRPDFDEWGKRVPTYASSFQFGAEGSDDWLAAVSGIFGSDALLYVTRLFAWGDQEDPSFPQIVNRMSSYGTISGSSGDTTITGTTTYWDYHATNTTGAAWAGCVIYVPDLGEYYVVDYVNSNTEMVLTSALSDDLTDAVYRLYQTHCIKRTDYLPHIETYWGGLIYHAPSLDDTIPPEVHGPLSSLATETTLGSWGWTTTAGAGSIGWLNFFDVYTGPMTATNGIGGTTMVAIGGKGGAASQSPNVWVNANNEGYDVDNWTVYTKPWDSELGNGIIWDETNDRFLVVSLKDNLDGTCDIQLSNSATGLSGSWTTRDVATSVAQGAYPSAAVATDGTTVFVYYRSNTTTFETYRSTDLTSWTNAQVDITAITGIVNPARIPWGMITWAIYDGANFVISLGAIESPSGDDTEWGAYIAYSSDGYSNWTAYRWYEDTDSTCDVGINTLIGYYSSAQRRYYMASIGQVPYNGGFWVAPAITGPWTFAANDASIGILAIDEPKSGIVYIMGTGGQWWTSQNGEHFNKFDTTDLADDPSGVTMSALRFGGVCEQDGKFLFFGADEGSDQPYLFGFDPSQTVSWRFDDDFDPVSKDYRANAFAVLNAYLVLMSTREYDSGWEFHPRRIRWSAPGDILDFDEAADTGAGVADLEGSGIIKDARTVNNRIVTFETNVIGAIIPRGYVDDPFQYEVLAEGVRTMSNPVVVKDTCYFVAQDGLLWQTNGIVCQDSGSGLDLTKFDDFDEVQPIWMGYSADTTSVYIYRYIANSSSYIVHSVNLNDGTVSTFDLPTITSNDDEPLSVLGISGATTSDVLVSYTEDDNDVAVLQIGSLSTGDAITGKDAFSGTSADEEYWYATLETGEVYLVPEGQKTSIKHIIVRTYCDGTAGTNPHLLVDVRSIEDSDWSNRGDGFGTITVTTDACTGDGTAFSHLVGRAGDEVDGSEVTFTCPAPPARVYLETGGTYTLQVLGTHYTVSGNDITFTAAPGAGNNLYVYWDNYPEVKVSVDDFIETTEGLHRITAVNVAGDAGTADEDTHLTLDHYLSTGSDATATHHPAVQVPNGQGEVKIGLNKLTEGCRIRIRIVPETGGDATVLKITSLAIGHEPCGKKVVEATGS